MTIALICGVGGAVTNVGAILALFGGIANACVTFVLPIIYWMMMFRAQWHWKSRQTALHCGIVIFSSIAAVLSTVSAAEELLLGGEP